MSRRGKMRGGAGHRPLSEVAPPFQLEIPKAAQQTFAFMQANTEFWGMGKLVAKMPEVRIFLSRPTADTKWHLTISRENRYPHWDEVTRARYSLIPDHVVMAMLLPPKDDYISLHDYVFQLVEVKEL